ncbi:hypothetical protein BJ170DRAFT_590398 [Xylariales sp. AK1849]|nr:hypothetical protein BJ170DRAFT_590398 [Xylariales sp. AK1849]
MSFGTSVGDILAVCQLASKLRKEFVNAEGQLKSIDTELRGLSHVLQDLEVVLSGEDLSKRRENDLCDVLVGCHDLLNELNNFVTKNSTLETEQTKFRGKARRVWKKLKWDPLQINDFRGRITSQATLLNLFVSSLTSDTVFKVRDGITHLNLQQDEAKKEKILDWISIEDYSLQQLDFLSRREEGTGTWLLDMEEFQSWESTDHRTLFCPGIPGGGKTIVASIVVDHLQTKFTNNDEMGIAFLYCNFRRKAEQSARDLLSSLLRQLLSQKRTIPHLIMKTYEECHQKKRHATFQEILDGLRVVIASFSRCYFIVDALDESQVSRDGRDKFLTELFKLQKSTKVNLFATSRHIPDIEDKFVGFPKIEVGGHKDDIRRYLVSSLPTLRSFVSRNTELQNETLDVISTSVDGMFLLAQLYIQSLQEKTTAKAIRVTLKTVPKLTPGTSASTGQSITPKAKEAYDLAYEEAMDRIITQHPDSRDLAMRVLAWITRAKRPLETRELCHALAVDDEDGLDPDNIPAWEDMISVCAGLAIVDEQSKIIRLIHYTTQEYFERSWQEWFPGAEEDIARSCLRYLLVNPQTWQFHGWTLGCVFDESQPFYEYACEHWGHHCRNSSLDGDPYLFEFFRREPNILKASQRKISELFAWYPVDPMRLSAFFGLYKTIEHLVSCGIPVNSESPYVIGPLHLAVYVGHRSVVALLLRSGASPNQTYRGKSPFFLAASREDIASMQMLIEGGADSNRKSDGLTPLIRAASDGSIKTFDFLMQCDKVDMGMTSWDGSTALIQASKNNHIEVVELFVLAARKFQRSGSPCPFYLDIRYSNYLGENALQFALTVFTSVTELIFETYALHPNEKNSLGRTLLFDALSYGNERVINYLLTSDPLSGPAMTFDLKDHNGETPLMVAARTQRSSAVSWLLTSGRVQPGLRNSQGMSAIHLLLDVFLAQNLVVDISTAISIVKMLMKFDDGLEDTLRNIPLSIAQNLHPPLTLENVEETLRRLPRSRFR